MDFARLDLDEATLVFDLRDRAQPAAVYLGPSLPAGAPLGELSLLWAEGPRPSTADVIPQVSLVPVAGLGFQGEPALVLADGRTPRLFLAEVETEGRGLRFILRDEERGIVCEQRWRALGGVAQVDTRLINEGTAPLALAKLAALTLPLPVWARRRLTFAGRWAGEFQRRDEPIPIGLASLASRGGRPGFDNPGFLILGAEDLGDERGLALALHVAWSGNVFALTEQTGFGQGQVQAGERLEPGEAALAPGEAYEAPTAILALTQTGYAGVRCAFHAHARAVGAALKGPRRVHFNSWEAVYFDLDAERLKTLAGEAAALGAERFVLDDGWFLNRRHDRSGLGDWAPDPERFPDGLAPLIEHVQALGMDFGLWVEPEMVNPDSALYREKPDWALSPPQGAAPTQRGQLVLNLALPAVQEHLLSVLDRLLRDHAIAYLKWDHNRDLFPAANPRGQLIAFYQLLDRLRAAHPDVEIESCASGGGRIDFGVMTRTHRFWLSDNTDAAVRLGQQTQASLFVPPARLGSHVGAAPNPNTGRRASMMFRSRIALFAHMGLEADPVRLSEADKEVLRAHIALYKEHRALIHDGVFHAFEGDDPDVTVWLCVAADGGEALGLAARVKPAAGLISAPVRLCGLCDDARYAVTLPEPWPGPARHFLGQADGWAASPVFSGALLRLAGLRLPLVHPETAWLFHLRRV